MQPGNHDSRNVGYTHFEDVFGERFTDFKKDNLMIVPADSSEPDLDNGQMGREYYKWIKNEFSSCPSNFKIFAMHHHLIPVREQAGKEI